MTNVIITGVGGQGVLLACRVLMEAAKLAGYDVKESEIHGMAQRGGSVECHIRFGNQVASPLVARDNADIIVAFELCEAVRKLEYLAAEGVLLVNNMKILPSTVESGAMEYPDNLDKWLAENISKAFLLDNREALADIGSKKCLNLLMLGAMAGFTSIPDNNWEEAIRNLVKPQYLEMNKKAFRLGRASFS